MKFKYYLPDGTLKGEKEYENIPEFSDNKGIHALRNVILAYQSNLRQGNASTKSRAQVKGTGKKPWRQKGTGMARHGSKRSPIWRGGGVAFGPNSRNHYQKINKKVKLLGLKRAFWDFINEGFIGVIESLIVNELKTKSFISILNNIKPKFSKNILFIDSCFEKKVMLSARNISNIFMINLSSLSAWYFVRFKNIIITERAINKFLNHINS